MLFKLNSSLYICILIFFYAPLNAQNRINFTHLTPKLDNQKILANQTIEDALGFIWITDNNGLYKYDGYDFAFIPFSKFFGKDFINTRKILFKKDINGNLWLAPYNGGLVMIHPDGTYKSLIEDIGNVGISTIEPNGNKVYFGTTLGSVYSYNLKNSKTDSLNTVPEIRKQPQAVINIAFTENNKMWVGTDNSKVYNFSKQENKLRLLNGPFHSNTKHSIKLASDNKGQLWISSELQGLYRYNIKNNIFKKFNTPIHSSTSKYTMYVSLYCDNSGDIWVATDGNGLLKIDSETDKVSVFIHNKENKFSINNNTIINVSEDSHGNLWIVDKKGVLNILPFNDGKIKYYSGSTNNIPTPVLSILKASDESLWIGTDGEGINRVFSNNTCVQYSNSSKGNHFFEGRYILQIVEDSKKNIWIATYQNGLFIYNINSKKFKKVSIQDKYEESHLDIRSLFIDSKNRIWAGHTGGIHILNENQNTIANFNYDSNGLFGLISESMVETSKGDILISTLQGGLFLFEENNTNIKNSHFKNIKYYSNTGNHTGNYDISFMSEDNKGNLWIKLQSGFLVRFNTKDYSYESLANKEHLKDLKLHTVLADNSEKIWLSSTNGLHQYNPKTETIKSYYEVNGLQGNSFSRRAAFKTKDGVLYFGGDKGMTGFIPENSFEKKDTSAKLYINQIEILNKPANTIIPKQLKGGVEGVKSLNLKSNQSSFSFQFSAIDNILDPNYYYAYRLQGFDKDWIVPKKGRVATYTNIPSGDYVFEVKSGSKKGVWDITPKTIDINIAQPIWNTPLAYIIYFILVSLLIYAIYLWIKLKNKLVNEELKHNNEKELYALKMNFFAKMSHEIQTPLTLISGPIENMLKNALDSGNTMLKERLSMISNNAKRLSKIVFKLTAIRDKELGQLKLRAAKNNIITDLKSITSSFKEQANFKKINFRCYYPDEALPVWYDKDKLEHIFYNLLSNAFKFTPKEGTIDFKVKVLDSEDTIKISVRDSGPGISKNELENIFKLFYQSDIGKKNMGNGIGLALTKELVHLHKGRIEVESISKKGACFSVFLSTKESIFSIEEKVFDKKKDDIEKEHSPKLLENKKRLDKTILIVEDNYELQIFLEDLFKDQYNILIADDGEEGSSLAIKHTPDLIISDIMMPNKDGLEMSNSLQRSRLTSHIPIILLTAKEAPRAKLLGLMTGAIEYINKPFNSNELIFRVHNIISRSDRLLSKYKTDLISTPKNTKAVSPDDIFLQRLMDIIEVEFKNSDFKLEDLSELLHMSYSAVYRKFQTLTGKTLVDFVRSVRLKKAAILITKYNYTISEATYTVGFNDPKYFTKCFKKEFKLTPMKFKKEAQNNNIDSFLKEYNLEQEHVRDL